MRKFAALFGSCLFFFIIMSLYLILDQFNSTLDSNEKFMKEAVKAAQSVEEIRTRMEKLEAGLMFSDKMIHTMNEKVNDIILKPKSEEPKRVEVKPIHFPKRRDLVIPVQQNVSSDMCLFTGSPSGHKQDIRMMDMFDKLPFDNFDGGVWKQGWNVKYEKDSFDEKKLLVFVVPHSHNDPGWLKTVERYFHDQTNSIIRNIIDALVRDPQRKFIWAETSYFQMWWDQTSFESKQMAQKVIKTGQLEIVTGGWVMNDEANPHYFNMLDQLVEGHQWLETHIGVKPSYGWAIDPFGYSSTMAYLLKRMHFDGMLIQRVHYHVKKHLALKKQLEFMWRQNWDHSDTTEIFTHVMPFYSYDIPHTCGPDPKICCQFDFGRLPGGGKFCPWHVPPRDITDSNVRERAELLLDQYRKKSQLYRSNVVFAPLGDDFRWDKMFEINAQFRNYDKIMTYVNTHPELKAEIKYGTLKDYFHAVAEREGVKPGKKPPSFPTLGGDFFTYADRDDHYWSGYYTSRAFFKHMDREVAAYLRGAELMFSLAYAHSRQYSNFPESLYPKLLLGRKQLALFQHHDGITGTAKDHVVVDYGQRLHDTIMSSMKIMETSINYLLTIDRKAFEEESKGTPLLTFAETYDDFDSIKRKKMIVISDEPTYVVLYNTLAQERRESVSFHVSEPLVEVYDYADQPVVHQVSLLWKSSTETVQSKYELTFVGVVPQLGLARYKIKRARSDDRSGVATTTLFNAVLEEKVDRHFSVTIGIDDRIKVENKHMTAFFDNGSGLLTDLSRNGKTHKVQIRFMTYGTVSKMDRSGAYLFLPSGQASTIEAKNTPVTVTRGKIYTEVLTRLQFVIHRIRIFHSDNYEAKSVNIQNTLDIRHTSNLELIMRIESDIRNKEKEFFTDLNGFQMQRRKTLKKLPLQANFYPVPAMAYIEDDDARLSLLTQQSNGVASLETGYLEVVLDRRLMQDDNRGLGQGVTDNKVTPSNFKLVLENFDKATKVKKAIPIPIGYPSLLAISLMHQLQHPMFTLAVSAVTPTGKFNPLVSGLNKALPCDVHLVNLKTLQDNIKELPSDTAALFLHRIGYDCSFPKSCMEEAVTFQDLFTPLTVHELESTSLSLMYTKKYISGRTAINISPMEIEAFKMQLR